MSSRVHSLTARGDCRTTRSPRKRVTAMVLPLTLLLTHSYVDLSSQAPRPVPPDSHIAEFFQVSQRIARQINPVLATPILYSRTFRESLTESLSIPLDANRVYFVSSTCEPECGIRLIASSKGVIDRPLDNGWHLITILDAGVLSLQVSAYACKTICSYGIAAITAATDGAEDRFAVDVAAAINKPNYPLDQLAWTLHSSAEYPVAVWLEPGRSYTIQALCENGCDGLELGVALDADTASDRGPSPSVKVQPINSGRVRIVVQMGYCQLRSCRVALVVSAPQGSQQSTVERSAPGPDLRALLAEKNVAVAVQVKAALTTARTSFNAAVKHIAVYSCGRSSDECYLRSDALGPVEMTRSYVLSRLNQPELAPLADFVDDSLDPILRELTPKRPESVVSQLVHAERVSLLTLSQPDYVIERRTADALLARVVQIIDSALEASSDIAINLSIDSAPPGARVEIFPRSRPGAARDTVTTGSLDNVYRGLYRYRVTAKGFAPGEGSLDLVHERPVVINCTLLSEAPGSASQCVARK